MQEKDLCIAAVAVVAPVKVATISFNYMVVRTSMVVVTI